MQIEIDRSLYMNEMRVRPNGNFDNFRTVMVRIVAELADIGRKKMRMADDDFGAIETLYGIGYKYNEE